MRTSMFILICQQFIILLCAGPLPWRRLLRRFPAFFLPFSHQMVGCRQGIWRIRKNREFVCSSATSASCFGHYAMAPGLSRLDSWR